MDTEMTKSPSEWPNLDYTAKGIQFAPWPTIVENDDLYLGKWIIILKFRLFRSLMD